MSHKVFALIAGETSGDRLGAGLIAALSKRNPGARFVGVAGPQMQAAGCEAWFDTEQLAVMGLAEVVRHLPRLLSLRHRLLQRLLAIEPDCIVGIDAPDFNLGVEKRLRQAKIPTVHYVSPSVWAWRRGRVKTMRAATDLVLTLFPFETAVYQQHGIKAVCVGHPLADQMSGLASKRLAARRSLGLQPGLPVVALLPGSRVGEVRRLLSILLQAGQNLCRHDSRLQLLLPCASATIRAYCVRISRQYPGLPLQLLDGRAQTVLLASDGALLASGTATLEAMLAGTPMVVTYRMSPLSAYIIKRLDLLHIERFSLPNLLAGEALVPEFIQDNARAEKLSSALIGEMAPPRAQMLRRRFSELHRSLGRGADDRAAKAVCDLLA